MRVSLWAIPLFASTSLLASCSSAGPELSSFALRFVATANGAPVGCTDTLGSVGPGGAFSVGPSDLRFYVSNLRFYDASGSELEVILDENEFQYHGPRGTVSLVDLTGNTEGTCAGSAIAFAEGTARTHDTVSGMTMVGDVARVTFDVGVPQAVMQETIATTSPESAPSPLDEMYWSWASGYRHFVFNFAVTRTADGGTGDGYIHIGSRDCAAEGMRALEDRERCTYLNTPAVSLEGLDLTTDVVAIDLRALLDGVDFVSPIYDPDTFEIIGEGPGVECHSSPMQADCATLFSAFGLDAASGNASAAGNRIFSIR